MYFPLFVASRIFHTAAYIFALQPLRNIAYQLGILVMFFLSSHIVWNVFVS